MKDFLIEIEKEVLKNKAKFKTGSISITEKMENLKNAEIEMSRINNDVKNKINSFINSNNLSNSDVKIIEDKLSESIEKLHKIMF